jgi:hypothetical protein
MPASKAGALDHLATPHQCTERASIYAQTNGPASARLGEKELSICKVSGLLGSDDPLNPGAGQGLFQIIKYLDALVVNGGRVGGFFDFFDQRKDEGFKGLKFLCKLKYLRIRLHKCQVEISPVSGVPLQFIGVHNGVLAKCPFRYLCFLAI